MINIHSHPFLKRAVLTALLLLSAGCSTCKRWHTSEICGRCPFYNSSIVYYTPECVATGIGFEVLRTFSGERFFINLYSFPIYQENIELTASCCEKPFSCYVMEGGQRLDVPQTEGNEIFAALCRGECVTINVACYSHTINPGIPR